MGHFLCFVYCCWPHFVSAVLFQTVQEAAGVGQPERDGLKIISSFLMKKKTSAEVCVHCRTFFSYLTQKKHPKIEFKNKGAGNAKCELHSNIKSIRTFKIFLMLLMVDVSRVRTFWSSLT